MYLTVSRQLRIDVHYLMPAFVCLYHRNLSLLEFVHSMLVFWYYTVVYCCFTAAYVYNFQEFFRATIFLHTAFSIPRVVSLMCNTAGGLRKRAPTLVGVIGASSHRA